MFAKDVIDEVLEAAGGVAGPERTDTELKVAVAGPERSLPLVPLLHPHLVVSVAQVNLCKDFRPVQAIQHLRYEG